MFYLELLESNKTRDLRIFPSALTLMFDLLPSNRIKVVHVGTGLVTVHEINKSLVFGVRVESHLKYEL